MARPAYIVAVEAAVFHQGRYLFIVRSSQDVDLPGILCLPGGKVELEAEREGILERSVRREVMEETGVDVEEAMHYVQSKTFVLGEGRRVLDAMFLCRYRSGAARPDGEESQEVLWLTAEELSVRPDAAAWLVRSIALAEERRRQLGWA